MKRRRVLQVMAGSAGVGLAGCADLLGDDGSDQSVDDESPEPETPDDQDLTDTPSDVPAPNVTELDVAMTDTRGTLSYSLAIEDEESTLSSLALRTPIDEKIIDIGDSVFETSGDIKAEPGRMNDLELIAENADDGAVEETAAAYARRHDEREIDNELHVSPVYHMFMGRGGPDGRSKWPDCAVGKPEIGEYSHDPSDFYKENRGAFERHFDDMHGYSMDTTSVLFGETDKSRDRLHLLYDHSTLFNETDIDITYPIAQVLRRERDIEEDMEFLANLYESHDNFVTIDDSPVVYFWGFDQLFTDETRDFLEQEYEDAPDLLSTMRDILTIDGIEPYFIANSHSAVRMGIEDDYRMLDEREEAYELCEATGNWFPALELVEESPMDGDEFLKYTERDMKGHAAFADEKDMDFIPVASPGFDDVENDCWGQDRETERSPEILEQSLQMAKDYGTRDLIYLATWNDWNEGTQIEPGSHLGEPYGDTYLEVVENYLT